MPGWRMPLIAILAVSTFAGGCTPQALRVAPQTTGSAPAPVAAPSPPAPPLCNRTHRPPDCSA